MNTKATEISKSVKNASEKNMYRKQHTTSQRVLSWVPIIKGLTGLLQLKPFLSESQWLRNEERNVSSNPNEFPWQRDAVSHHSAFNRTRRKRQEESASYPSAWLSTVPWKRTEK
jgi:hypothetical protein